MDLESALGRVVITHLPHRVVYGHICAHIWPLRADAQIGRMFCKVSVRVPEGFRKHVASQQAIAHSQLQNKWGCRMVQGVFLFVFGVAGR